MTIPFSSKDIARRSPVWVAMSELFLDTSLTKQELSQITEAIRTAGFTADEAEGILLDEVAPIFGWNLLSVAGEWLPWDETVVAELVLERLSKRNRLRFLSRPRRWLRGRLIRLISDDWNAVKKSLAT